MPTTSPASLSLELAVSQKRVRAIARELYGTLPEGTTRWELTEEQSDAVRARLGGRATRTERSWTLEPGDTVRRRAIHEAYGGQQQGGISTPRSLPDVLVFTDPKSGARYGYDAFEGLRGDGTYAYTGEGQHGQQTFVRGNRALRDSAEDGKTIRLFTTAGVYATYVGSFALADPPFALQTIPDVDGVPREGIIFNLAPLDADVKLLPSYGGPLEKAEGALMDYAAFPRVWSPPDYSDVILPGSSAQMDAGERVVSRVEFELQAAFGSWLIESGTPPQRLPLRTENVIIEPDFHVPDRGWVVEAKKSSARGYVRAAIGQVLDYVYVARKAGMTATPVILLPGKPVADLVELMGELRITLVVRSDEAFDVFVPKERRAGR